MSQAKLKRELKTLSKEEIIDVLLNLYDARKEAKEYLDFFISPNEDAEQQKYKDLILNEFYPKKGEPKVRFSICRKAISDFKKLKPSAEVLADLMLFYIEIGVKFTVEYGDMWEQYYTAIENNFDSALKYISKNCNREFYQERIEKLLKESDCCGWGFPYTLADIYYEYYGDIIEE